MEEAFDYVIVGAGSAGCAVAARLSEDPGASVLVLEAGGKDRSPNIKLPAAFSKQFRTKLDWDYSTGPEPHLDDRELYVPRGKSLGGCSSMNAMMWVRGRPLDFDGWREAGCPGWGYDDVLPYFKRMENYEDGDSGWHGSGGPVNVTKNVPTPRPLTHRFMEAAQRAGIPVNPDINSPEQDGVAMTPVTQRNGRRWSSADALPAPGDEAPQRHRQDGRPGARDRPRRLVARPRCAGATRAGASTAPRAEAGDRPRRPGRSAARSC